MVFVVPRHAWAMRPVEAPPHPLDQSLNPHFSKYTVTIQSSRSLPSCAEKLTAEYSRLTAEQVHRVRGEALLRGAVPGGAAPGPARTGQPSRPCLSRTDRSGRIPARSRRQPCVLFYGKLRSPPRWPVPGTCAGTGEGVSTALSNTGFVVVRAKSYVGRKSSCSRS